MSHEQLPQSEQFRTRVVLDFFRHDEKDQNKTEPKKTDEEVELTDAGRYSAKGQANLDKIDFAIATATDRTRAQQTAGYHMAGNIEGITGDESLDDLKNKIDGKREYGSKMRIDNRLNFKLVSGSSFEEEAMKNFKDGRYLKFLVENSDSLAEQLGDAESSTYSRQASNVAEIVSKYVEVAKNFDKLYQSTVEEERATNELQRFFGSHQGVTESFLAKVIEKVKGIHERDRFVKILGNQGFDFSEGFQIEVLHTDGSDDPKINICFKKEKGGEVFEFNEEVSLEDVKELIIKKDEER